MVPAEFTNCKKLPVAFAVEEAKINLVCVEVPESSSNERPPSINAVAPKRTVSVSSAG